MCYIGAVNLQHMFLDVVAKDFATDVQALWHALLAVLYMQQ
jgi:hypothetical protein